MRVSIVPQTSVTPHSHGGAGKSKEPPPNCLRTLVMGRLGSRCWLAGMAFAAGLSAQQAHKPPGAAPQERGTSADLAVPGESVVRGSSKAGEEPLPPEATFGTTVVIPAGLRGRVYLLAKDTTVLPDFERDPLKLAGEIWTNELNIAPRHWRSGFPGLTDRFEWFAIDYTGKFWIADPGRYTFALISDDGSRLFIDDTPLIDNDCQHPPDLRVAAVRLEGGVHRIRVAYFQGPRDCLALLLVVAGPDRRWRVFDVREFTPPSNPDDWRFPSASSSVAVPTTPEEASLTIKALDKCLLESHGEDHSKIFVKGGRGCSWQATRSCGKD